MGRVYASDCRIAAERREASASRAVAAQGRLWRRKTDQRGITVAVKSKVSKGGGTPDHRIVVVPWLKGFMQKFVLPDWTAITIGKRIFAWRDLDEVELAHEL